MAFFFGDGFDLYTVGADMVGHWDATSTNPNSSGLGAGRFTGSRSINVSSASRYHKVNGSNDSVHHFVFAILSSNITGSSLGACFQLDDGTTAQCSVVMRSDGVLLLTSGTPAGAALATFSAAMVLSNVWYAFEVEVVVHNTNGSITVRRNGSPVDDFSVGGLDTSLSGNNYANRLQFGSQSAATFFVDDLIWRSDAASVPWLGDVRCYTRYPISDVSAQFSRTTAPFSQVISGTAISSTYSANTAYYVRFVATYSGMITGGTVNCNVGSGGSTGHVKLAIFSSLSTGAIGTVLATSAEVTAPGQAIIQFTFPSPVRIERGQTYWIGVNQDASTTYNVVNTNNTVVLAGSTYASWPTSSPGGTVGNNNVPGTLGIAVTPGINADVVSEPQQDANTSYVYSTTNGHADFYGIGALVSIPATTLAVTTRGYFTKSDAGTRNATVQLKSGATTVQGASSTFSAGIWTWVGRTDLVDPATGVAWTASGVNTINIGPIVTA